MRRKGKPVPVAAKAPGKCSAFIATGSATKDGKILIAHSNWSSYAEGENWTVAFDVVPAKGFHFLMDGSPGLITSQDDFGVNSAGLMITETTLPMGEGIRCEGDSGVSAVAQGDAVCELDCEYAAIMRKGEQRGLCELWLIGDRKTNEIAYLELGMRHTPLTVKKDGFFVSSNFAQNAEVIRDDTPGFNPNDAQSSMNARHIRALAFMKEHYGKLDTALAEANLSDHYDTYEKKVDAGMRSLCGHEETSSRGEPVWAMDRLRRGGGRDG